MPKFMKPLVVKKLESGQWEVYEELEYHVGNKDSNEVIIVPKGTLTDFASVPRGLWNIFPPDGKYSPAAVIHDYLYQTNGLDGKYTRRQSDDILFEAMGVLGVPGWKKHLMYAAVWTFGRKFWKG